MFLITLIRIAEVRNVNKVSIGLWIWKTHFSISSSSFKRLLKIQRNTWRRNCWFSCKIYNAGVCRRARIVYNFAPYSVPSKKCLLTQYKWHASVRLADPVWWIHLVVGSLLTTLRRRNFGWRLILHTFASFHDFEARNYNPNISDESCRTPGIWTNKSRSFHFIWNWYQAPSTLYSELRPLPHSFLGQKCPYIPSLNDDTRDTQAICQTLCPLFIRTDKR